MTPSIDTPVLGVLITGLDGRVLQANDAFLNIVGYANADFKRERVDWRELTPPEWHATISSGLQQVSSGGTTQPLEREYVRTDGTRVDVLLWSTRVNSEPKLLTLALDFDAQKLAQERLRLLAEASAILTSSLDYQKTVETLAKLVVPALGDWCAVDIVVEDEEDEDAGDSDRADRASSSATPLRLQRLAAQHQDARKLELARQLHERYPPDLSAPRGLGHVLRSGQSEWMADIPAELVQAAAQDDEHRAILEELGLRSYVVVPLQASGRVFGALTLVYAESGRRYTEADVRFAEEVAARAATAVEHARLYRQAQKARREVEAQRAMLELIVRQSGDGIIMADATGAVRVFNPAAATQHGVSAHEGPAAWAEACDVVTVDGAPLSLNELPLWRAVRGESVTGARWQVKRADGSVRTLSGTASPLAETDGTPAGGVLTCRDETEQLSLQEALAKQARLTRVITDNATAGLLLLDERQRCTYLNPAAEKMFGFTFAQIKELDAPLHSVVHHSRPDGSPYPEQECPLVASLTHGTQSQGEEVFTRRDGTFYPVAFTASPLLSEGKASGAVFEVRDISEEKRAQHERERMFHSIVENLPEPAWAARPDGYIDYFNSRWYEYTGTDAETVRGWGWQTVHDPEVLPQVIEHWKGCLATGDPFETEYRLKGADGTYRWFIARVRPLRDDTGKIVRWFGQNTNIDSQKRAQESQRRETRRAVLAAEVGTALTQGRSLAESLSHCTDSISKHLDAALARIWTLDARHEMLELQSSSGPFAHIDGGHARMRVGESKIGRIAKNAEPHLTNEVANDPLVPENSWTRGHGIISFAGYPLRIGNRVVGVMAVYSRQPLTNDTWTVLASIADSIAMGIERRSAEKEAHEERDALEIINHVGRSLAAELDQDKLVSSLTDAATRLVGAQIGVFAPNFAGERSVRIEDARLETNLSQSKWFSVLQSEASTLTSYLAVPVTSRTGEVLGGLLFGHSMPSAFNERHESLVAGVAAQAAVAMDNARLFQKAEALIQSLERSNKELEQFAYVASHDLKAPLRGIANLSAWLEEDLDDVLSDDSRQQMNLLRGRVHRLESLINGILSYSRAGRVREKPEEVDISKLVDETVELLAPPPEATIRVVSELPVLTTARAPMQQLFLNLIANALKHSQRSDVVVEIGATERDQVWEFFVSDNGPGVPAQYQERIWGIFQTLAARDKVEGTGVGLSVVRKIAEAKGGQAWLDTETESGCTFRFTWPKRELSPAETMERANG